MGMQLVFDASDESKLAETLASHGVTCEMFPMPDGRLGISIPTRVVEVVGESTMESILGSFTYIDLWSGGVREKVRHR
ncbi:hypothetical protein J2T07_002485 [Luteibacter jiangsuensis]|uniref:Uncharacterized protein n=1 Tax=Luteibacter jiangsuensis TaxID=637577 RepID=A0ABT9SZ64_9GAMM|nr:hypothetical protein [Luteibacter jiangsuensis]